MSWQQTQGLGDPVMCLHFPTKGGISGSVAFPHFLWLLFPLHSLCFFLVPSHMVIYIVLPLLLKSEVKFSSL